MKSTLASVKHHHRINAHLCCLGAAALGFSAGPVSLPAQTQTLAISTTANTYGQRTVRRAVRVIVNRGNLFPGAMVAKQTIDMNGNDILTDSFDSTNPRYSTNGQYDPAKSGDMGDVATNVGITNSINAGNANIYGHAHTGPNGVVAVGPNGAVGEHAWQANNHGLEPGWVRQDSNFTFPDTSLPYTTGMSPASGNVVTSTTTLATNTATSTTYPSPVPSGGVTTNVTSYTTVSTYPSPPPAGLTTNATTVSSSTYPNPAPSTVATNTILNAFGAIIGYTYTYLVYTFTYPNYSYTYSSITTTISYATNYYDHILYSGDYSASSLSGGTIVLGDARLVLPNGLSMNGNDTFTVAQGGRVKVFCDGSSVSLGGKGVFNRSGAAPNLIFYGTPKVTSFSITANGTFQGALVAPSADLTLNGGGNSVTDFCGSIMVNSVKMKGHFRFHYDLALGKDRSGRFLLASWNEISADF